MDKLFAILIIVLMVGCTVINREYTIVLQAEEGSTINFPLDIMAEVPKDIDIEADIETSLKIPLK